MVKFSRLNLFNFLSSKTTKKASFVNDRRDTSSADKITFSDTHNFDVWKMPMHGDYGVFIGGNGTYPTSLMAQVTAHAVNPQFSPPTVGIEYQNIIEGVVKL